MNFASGYASASTFEDLLGCYNIAWLHSVRDWSHLFSRQQLYRVTRDSFGCLDIDQNESEFDEQY